MEAEALAHPVFQPLRRILDGLGPDAGLETLNAAAQKAAITVASGRPLRFVPPSSDETRYGEYELRVHETGCVETRPGNLHDFFNALAWLAFPATKAALNELHARQIPLENGRRGRFRDLLTLFDEGGAIVACDDPGLVDMLRGHRWKALFWEQREEVGRALRIQVLGHAVLEQSLHPWPGITCKVIFVPLGCDDADRAAAGWLRALPESATPRDMASLPIFGYPGWLPASANGNFYDDARYFRPLSGISTGKMRAGVGQAVAAAVRRAEESPGSAERDAG